MSIYYPLKSLTHVNGAWAAFWEMLHHETELWAQASVDELEKEQFFQLASLLTKI